MIPASAPLLIALVVGAAPGPAQSPPFDSARGERASPAQVERSRRPRPDLRAAAAPADDEARARAESALLAARAAIEQSSAEAERKGSATSRLREAEAHFDNRRFQEAARAADAAWNLVLDTSAKRSEFSVEVSEQGDTRVATKTGLPVQVAADGRSTWVAPGKSVEVRKGTAARTELGPPGLLSPRQGELLRRAPRKEGIGPITFEWRAVAGASGYRLEVFPQSANGPPRVLRVRREKAQLEALPAGRYLWTVRALGPAEEDSRPSEQRSFALEPDALTLEVKGATWK